MFRLAFKLLSPAGTGARLSIFIFHRVHRQRDEMAPGEPDAERFDDLCGWFARWFNVLPLDAAVAGLRAGQLPARAACITFDDGYADNHDVALPILQRHGLAAAFFIATGYLDGGRMFNDTVIEILRRCRQPVMELDGLGLGDLGRIGLHDMPARRAAVEIVIGALKYLPVVERTALTEALRRRVGVDRLPDDLMMTPAQVKALHRAGMQIGAHTVSHPILARLEPAAARHEIVESRRVLEDLLGERVGLFAYPNGRPGRDYTAATADLVRAAGFDAAVSTEAGMAGTGADVFQLPRFTPWDRSKARFGARLLKTALGGRATGVAA